MFRLIFCVGVIGLVGVLVFVFWLFVFKFFFFSALDTFPGAPEEAGVSISSSFQYTFILLNFHVYFVTKASIVMSHGSSGIIGFTQGRTAFLGNTGHHTIKSRNSEAR